MALLDTSNVKSAKAGDFNFINALHYLPPDDLSGRKLCSHSTEGCRAVCLGWYAGRGVFQHTRDARQRRAEWLKRDMQGYLTALAIEIVTLQGKALRRGMGLCVRLNGSSDLPWENMRMASGMNLYEMFSGVQFVEYTKNPDRMAAFLDGKFPHNCHLTFSHSEENLSDCLTVLLRGGNVAVLFEDGLPPTWKGYRVIDGDKSDLRHLDDKNVVVGLRPKGNAIWQDTTGFVVRNPNPRPAPIKVASPKPIRAKAPPKPKNDLPRGRPPTSREGFTRLFQRLVGRGDYAAAKAVHEAYWRPEWGQLPK